MNARGTVLAYHGCDRAVGEAVLAGSAEIEPSRNDYDWLGSGAYFWEGSAGRALDWARLLSRRAGGSRSRVAEPFVVGAIIAPGLCLDLTEADSLGILRTAHDEYAGMMEEQRAELPQNQRGFDGDEDLVKRRLDCAVINFLHEFRAAVGEPPFDTVRCPFFEGEAIFPGSKIAARTHLQWCVRDPKKSIIGYFRVRP